MRNNFVIYRPVMHLDKSSIVLINIKNTDL